MIMIAFVVFAMGEKMMMTMGNSPMVSDSQVIMGLLVNERKMMDFGLRWSVNMGRDVTTWFTILELKKEKIVP